MSEQNHFATSEETCNYVASASDTALLAFSTGKDAIGAYIQMRRHFRRIVPYYMYLVPDLEFIEESLEYYEKWMGQKIIRIPHPSLYRWINSGVFQPPERGAVIKKLDLPNPDYSDMQQAIRDDLGLGDKCYVATGVRAADSPMRRVALTRFGSVNHGKKQFWPVWDWNKERLISEIESDGVRLPVDYLMFGRSFDGIDYRFLEPLSRHRPADYSRILEWFPLAGLEIKRRQYA